MNVSVSLPFKLRRAFVQFAAACFSIILSASAQDKPATPATSAPAVSAPANSANPAAFSYEVISVKPYKVDTSTRISIFTRVTANGFSAQGMDLLGLVMNAYPVLTADQIIGLHSTSIFDERYSIEAKMDEKAAAALNKLPQDQQQETRRAMLQALLADRFNLKAHKETRELPLYNLVVAKGGPKLKESTENDPGKWHGGWGEISGDGIAMIVMLRTFASQTHRYVVDKTGLSGKFSFSLKWNPLDGQDVPAQLIDQFKDRPDLFIALEEQLGLKLESAKGPVDVYVIDHIEKPSVN